LFRLECNIFSKSRKDKNPPALFYVLRQRPLSITSLDKASHGCLGFGSNLADRSQPRIRNSKPHSRCPWFEHFPENMLNHTRQISKCGMLLNVVGSPAKPSLGRSVEAEH